MRSSRAHFLALGTAVALLCGPAAIAQTSGEPTDLPVLSDETPRGEGIAELAAAITPVAKTVDGLIGDWVGVSSRYGGTAVYSGGEYVYQDHLFEARGADDGRDAAKLERLEMLKDVPGIYRVDALSQANAPGEFGVPIPEDFSYDDTYGDAASHQDHADLAEVRVAVQGDYLHVLARTTTMKADSPPTGLLLLADTKTGTTTLPVPFNSGISTTRGDVAVFMSGTMRSTVDLATNAPGPLTTDDVATNADGFTNAIEARVPLGLVTGADGNLHLAIASGTANETGTAFTDLDLETNDAVVTANLANVAFRDEPVRVWFEKEQALSLFAGTIDPFFRTVEPIALGTANETYVPGPGYHDRIFISESTPSVLSEGGENGSFQHYGLYLPSAIANSTADLALQWWLHWRGGSAHVAGGFIPKMFKQYGEDRNAIVVSPSGRGSSLWYVGKGHVDFLEVWANLFEAYGGRIDRNRVYVSGHSMGGFGTFLMTVLYPDRFAAGVPVSPPVTQGAWTGLDFDGCDEFEFKDGNDSYTPCYINANGSRPRDQHTRKLLENLRHVPLAIFAGAQDELVPYSGVFRQHERLVQLGYQHRLYTNFVAEHYTPPAMDQWEAVAAYEHQFVRRENPARVTYIRDMPFERATEEVQATGLGLNFDFDSAYWMSHLTPVNLTTGQASFDGSSLAIPSEPHQAIPDTDAPTAVGEAGPYVVTGLRWVDDPTTSAPALQNRFTATLKGASAVRVDLARMSIDPGQIVTAAVATDSALDLQVDGGWFVAPTATVDGSPATVTFADGVVHIMVPPSAAAQNIVITPSSGGDAIPA